MSQLTLMGAGPSGSGAKQGGIDSYTKLMLHLDNNFTDSSLSPHTVTNTGNAISFSNSIYKFGGFAGIFVGGTSTNALSTPDSADWDLGAGDWTLDFWIYWNTHTQSGIILSQSSNASNDYRFIWSSVGQLQFRVQVAGNPGAKMFHCSHVPTNGQWYHYEFSRNGATNYIFVNGVSQSVTTDAALGTIANQTGSLLLGFNTNIGFAPDANIDEFRYSVGICRHTANFTPPAAPYTT